jgi:hypothetical protein
LPPLAGMILKLNKNKKPIKKNSLSAKSVSS